MARNITTTVYQFDELSDTAKQQAILDYREQQDFPWLSDDLSNRLEELLEENGITYDMLPLVYYCLSYSQGDGCMFEGTVDWKAWSVTAKQYGLYYHENSKTLSMESRATGKEPKPEVEEQFNQIYVDICRKLEEYGYNIIEAETSDENIGQYLSEMEHEFKSDGSQL